MSETPDPEVVELATKIFDLARRGEAEVIAAYVDAGVPANLTNDRGDSLVMLAAYHGHADAVQALLSRGADPDRANDRGQTPLAGAVFKGRGGGDPRALVDGGADPSAGTPSPWTRHGCSTRRTCWSCSAPSDRGVVNVVASAKWLGHHDVGFTCAGTGGSRRTTRDVNGPALGPPTRGRGRWSTAGKRRRRTTGQGVARPRHGTYPGCVDSLM